MTEAPAAPAPTLANAAVFECDGGGELQVQFNYGDKRSVTVSVNGAAPLSLPAKDDATEPMYTDGAKTLTVDMDSVLWNDGSGDKSCKGVDLITFDADGRIVEFEVLIRPANALHALSQEMAARLALKGSALK